MRTAKTNHWIWGSWAEWRNWCEPNLLLRTKSETICGWSFSASFSWLVSALLVLNERSAHPPPERRGGFKEGKGLCEFLFIASQKVAQNHRLQIATLLQVAQKIANNCRGKPQIATFSKFQIPNRHVLPPSRPENNTKVPRLSEPNIAASFSRGAISSCTFWAFSESQHFRNT